MFCYFIYTGTSSPSTSPPPLVEKVQFLGLDLSSGDAEVGLYVSFGFLITTTIAVIAMVMGLLKTNKKMKQISMETMRMDRM